MGNDNLKKNPKLEPKKFSRLCTFKIEGLGRFLKGKVQYVQEGNARLYYLFDVLLYNTALYACYVGLNEASYQTCARKRETPWATN